MSRRDEAVAAVESRCPRCSSARERTQEYCVECGLRLPPLRGSISALRRRWVRRLGWYPGDWVWVSLVTLCVAAAGAAAAIALGDGPGSGGGTTAVAPVPRPVGNEHRRAASRRARAGRRQDQADHGARQAGSAGERSHGVAPGPHRLDDRPLLLPLDERRVGVRRHLCAGGPGRAPGSRCARLGRLLEPPPRLLRGLHRHLQHLCRGGRGA